MAAFTLFAFTFTIARYVRCYCLFGQRCDARHWRSADVRSDPAAGEGKAGQVQQMSGTRRVELAAKRHQNYGRHRWFVLCCFYIGRRRCIIVSLNIIITLQRRNVLRATVRGCLLNYLQFVNVWGGPGLQ